ncbi:heme exporter protein D (cytochrome C-type biogenesis protein) [Escherichia coli]|uniref:Heme exporter protein D n=1 Tax=Escherichia coli TaxID=562 RepID=A0A376ZJQ5_ECOLX|nr:heme exporter protein D (cytochrome C-type biogenesis protein) [Escherichia coli]
MTPAFASWNEFFAMGGYAFFVWLAVVMTLFRWWFWSCTR